MSIGVGETMSSSPKREWKVSQNWTDPDVKENTMNMVKVAMEQPALAHFTHVDVK
jgi:hypothetical protein